MILFIAVDLTSLKPPVMEGLDALIAVSMLFCLNFFSLINFLLGKFLCFLLSFIQKKKRKEKTSELESNGSFLLQIRKQFVVFGFFEMH